MTSSHPDIQAFADGELTADEAEAARTHLASCSTCQHELHEVMQLDSAVFEAAKAEPVAKVQPLKRSFARRFAPVMGLVSLAAAAALIILVTRQINGDGSAESALTLTGSRSMEARVTWPAADAWRPYDTVRGPSSAASTLSLTQLARLETTGDLHALADALLINGDGARAKALLEALSSEKPDVLADLSAAALVAHHPEEALELAQAALDVSPKHAAAEWNKALAARELGLTGVASRAFAEVAALHEAGWSREAAERSTVLRAELDQRRARFESARAAGVKMIFEHVPMPSALVTAAPSMARMYLAYAFRTAATAEEAKALEPVANQLSFHSRSPARNAADMRALFAFYFQRVGVEVPENEVGLTEDKLNSLVKKLVAQKQLGDLLFALPMARALNSHFELYEEAVAATNDPFFTFALENERASRGKEPGDGLLAKVANEAVTVAPLRAMQALEQLAIRAHAAHRATDAQNAAQRAIALAREQGEFVAETRLLSLLADAARFRDQRGLAQAVLEERVERAPEACAARQYSAESSAALEILMLEPKRARERLATATADRCSGPLSLVGAIVLADVIRLGASMPGDGKLLASSLAAARPEESMLAKHIEGRAVLDVRPVEGEALLREAIALARASTNTGDSTAKKVKTYGYGLLKNAAAERSDFQRVFSLSQEELGGAEDSSCTMLVDVQDNRVGVAARTASGSFTGAFERVPIIKHHRDGLANDEIARVVAPVAKALGTDCASVRVRASYPLNGRTGWLPDEFAWSYASNQPPRTPIAGPWLWVHDVDGPAQYKRLGSGPAAVTFERMLSGSAATPENVIEQMRDASLIEIDAHGVVDEGSDTAHLVLATGASGFALDGRRIASLTLEKHPTVVLGACQASRTAPFIHETVSLPQAFLEAGASAVVAAPVDLPDADARAFFGSVLTRVRTGEPVARAVRDERLQWLQKQGGVWVRQVLVFN